MYIYTCICNNNQSTSRFGSIGTQPHWSVLAPTFLGQRLRGMLRVCAAGMIGAVVTRGPHWDWEDQDGGEGRDTRASSFGPVLTHYLNGSWV